MATITGYTAERMKEIEDLSIVDGVVVGDNLVLVTRSGQQVNAGSVRGPAGPVGPQGALPEAPMDGGRYVRQNGLWVPQPDPPLRDTLANLNANDPVVAVGRFVVATDSVPQLIAIGDGVTPWSKLPKQDARASTASWTTSQFSIAAGTTWTDRAGLTVTFTVGDRAWVVEVNEPTIRCSAAAGLGVVGVRDAGNVVRGYAYAPTSNTAVDGFYWGGGVYFREIISVPGTYTRKVSIANEGSGTLLFSHNSTQASITARAL